MWLGQILEARSIPSFLKFPIQTAILVYSIYSFSLLERDIVIKTFCPAKSDKVAIQLSSTECWDTHTCVHICIYYTYYMHIHIYRHDGYIPLVAVNYIQHTLSIINHQSSIINYVYLQFLWVSSSSSSSSSRLVPHVLSPWCGPRHRCISWIC